MSAEYYAINDVVELAYDYRFYRELVAGVWPCDAGGSHVLIHGIGILNVPEHPHEIAVRLGWAERPPPLDTTMLGREGIDE